jgi:hypothetical protein
MLAAASLAAQPRLAAPIDASRMVTLKGHRHPDALPEADRGPVDPAMRLPYVTLLFKPDANQQADLQQLRAAQQDPSSPGFHRWLSPGEYADRFGLDAQSLEQVRKWLEGNGLKVEAVARSRTWISFSGEAGQVARTLLAPLHYYDVQGSRHYALSAEPSIPAALEPFIAGLRGLDDFHASPALAGNNGANYLAPDDLAVIYDIAPLYGAGIDGTGEKIAVVGESEVNLDDLHAYRSLFGLAPQDPQMIAVPDTPLVGQTGDNHQREASLDLEIVGAVARKATLVYIYGPSVEDAIRLAIDTAVAPVLSSSYLLCEKATTQTYQADILMRATEAAAKGMTWVNASGDAGPAGCDAQAVAGSVATHGLAVNFLAAPPEVTAVGGTRFSENSTSDWAGGNTSARGSALQYIPEMGWNDSSAQGGVLASGGGVSRLVPQPVWQSFPTGGKRAIPDVSLSASTSHDPYVFCNQANCTGGGFGLDGGTSAAAPAFAGIVALLGQYSNAPDGLGAINEQLYRLAAVPGPFHDITAGNNVVNCQVGTPDCTSGSYGFNAAPGYDLVTGLGTVDAAGLAGTWAGRAPSSTSIALSATSLQPGQSANLTATVQCGATPPAGKVSLTAGAKPVGTATLSAGANGSTASLTILSTQLTAGTNNITAWFSGSASCAASSATAEISLNSPQQASSVGVFVSPSPVYEQAGGSWTYTITLKESGGGAAALTGYKVNGTDFSSQLGNFGSTQIPAYGVLSGNFTLSGAITPPAALTIEIDGTDVNGAWVKTTQAIFLGFAGQAALQLTGVPSAVMKNSGNSSCPWSLKLALQETAGIAVTLNEFVTPFADLSGQVVAYWGSPCPTDNTKACLAANAKLTTTLCLSNLDSLVPTLLDYVVGGLDAHNNSVSAAISVPYLAPSASPNTLAVSPASITVTNAPLLVNVTASNAAQVWTVGFASGSKPAWLNLSQFSGTGSGTLVLSATAGSLASGTYTESIFVQSLDAAPQFAEVAITFVVK